MKRVLVWLCIAGLVIGLTVCKQPLGPGDQGSGEVDAAAKTSEMINLIVESQATGDFGELEAMLAEDDPDGELRQILAEQGVFSVATPKALAEPLDLPLFTDNVYENGDVLVSRGSGNQTATMMSLILLQGYSHAGILNKDLADEPDWACILSADVDYLTGTGDASVNYETYGDWITKNDVITVLFHTGDHSGVGDAIRDIEVLSPGTIYAFMGYPGAVVGAFEPIPKGNDKYWYCSKVPWRVYELLNEDIEDFWFYGQPVVPGGPQRWELFKNSVIYKIYMFYLKLQHPWWWPMRWIIAEADKDLWYDDESILKVLVSPDELRASPMLERKFSVVASFPYPYKGDDAPVLGWPEGTYTIHMDDGSR